MESRASGFVAKDAPPEQFAGAIRRVAAGNASSTRRWLPNRGPPEPARCPPGSGTSWSPRVRGPPCPRSPGSCSCPKEPSATTYPPRSPRPGHATAPRRSGWPRNKADSEHGSKHPHRLGSRSPARVPSKATPTRSSQSPGRAPRDRRNPACCVRRPADLLDRRDPMASQTSENGAPNGGSRATVRRRAITVSLCSARS